MDAAASGVFSVKSALQEENRELLWSVSAEDQDAFDVAGATGTRDERNKARIIRRVLALQECKSFGQIRNQLFAPGENNVMRREDG